MVLITGGTSGIGLALSEALIASGAQVIVCARSPKSLAEYARTHPEALTVRADVTRADDRSRLLGVVADRYGRLDILVNNAGTFDTRDFTGPDAGVGLQQELDVNFLAPIHLTAETLDRWPGLDAIVIVTSGYALVSPSRAPTYGAAKAGLHGFAEGLRRQLAPRGTHVLEVLPPLVDTPMNSAVRGRKISAASVARITLDALARGKSQARPGASWLLPALLRVAPEVTARAIDRI